MTSKNTRMVATVAIAALLLAMAVYVGRDLLLSRGHVVHCADGPHRTIDMRDFATQYWAYSANLETNVAGKVKLSTELDPKVLAQVSQGLQEAREVSEYVVAGYNSCAITQAQYAQLGTQFHALDNLAQGPRPLSYIGVGENCLFAIAATPGTSRLSRIVWDDFRCFLDVWQILLVIAPLESD